MDSLSNYDSVPMMRHLVPGISRVMAMTASFNGKYIAYVDQEGTVGVIDLNATNKSPTNLALPAQSGGGLSAEWFNISSVVHKPGKRQAHHLSGLTIGSRSGSLYIVGEGFLKRSLRV